MSGPGLSLTGLLVPSFTAMLGALAAWLDKAAAHEAAAGRDPDALTGARLHPDMAPLAAQVRFACFLAQEPLHRLGGTVVPASLDRIRDDAWTPGRRDTLADLGALIEAALAALRTLGPDALGEDPGGALALDLPTGLVFDLTRLGYARDWALPQFQFHIVTAYAILRAAGVPLGKVDYVGHLMAAVRPGTMPPVR